MRGLALGIMASVAAGAVGGIDTRQLLIDSFAIADRVYVETVGDDGTGDGSIGAPYATIDHAISQATAGDAIVIGGGEFTLDIKSTYFASNVFFSNTSNGISFIGTPNSTTLVSAAHTSTNRYFFSTGDVDTKFYFLHFKKDNGGETSNTATPMFTYPASGQGGKGRAYNCIFEELNANGTMSVGWSAAGSDWQFNNCTVIASNMIASLTVNAEIIFKNSACTGTKQFGTNAASVNNIDNVTLDVDYRIDMPVYTAHDFFRVDITQRLGTYLQIDEIDLIADDDTVYPTVAMTSENTPSPHVVTANINETGAYASWKAFDNNPTGTGWSASTSSDPYIAIQLPAAIKLKSIKLRSRSGTNFMPRDFRVSGSNDSGTTLKPLLFVTDQTTDWGDVDVEFFVPVGNTQGVYSGIYSWGGHASSFYGEFILAQDLPDNKSNGVTETLSDVDLGPRAPAATKTVYVAVQYRGTVASGGITGVTVDGVTATALETADNPAAASGGGTSYGYTYLFKAEGITSSTGDIAVTYAGTKYTGQVIACWAIGVGTENTTSEVTTNDDGSLAIDVPANGLLMLSGITNGTGNGHSTTLTGVIEQVDVGTENSNRVSGFEKDLDVETARSLAVNSTMTTVASVSSVALAVGE